MDEMVPVEETAKKAPEIGFLGNAEFLEVNPSGSSPLEMVGVCKTFEEGRQALTDVSVRIEKGKFVYLLGPNGAGKTTLFKLLYAAERPTLGELRVNGYEVHRLKMRQVPFLRRSLGIVFQDLKLISRWTVFENVAFALQVLGREKKEIVTKASQALQQVGLEGKGHFPPSQLSAGEQQRAAIARAIVNEPALLLADEPTGNIDLRAAEEIVRLFEEINLRGTTILFATHDEGLPAFLPKDRIVLEQGRIVESTLTAPRGRLRRFSLFGGSWVFSFGRRGKICFRTWGSMS
jgi:cell division transport system ATP-binding protein